jgi:hypothetical protein
MRAAGGCRAALCRIRLTQTSSSGNVMQRCRHAGRRGAQRERRARSAAAASLTSGTAVRRAPGRCAPQIWLPRRAGRSADRVFQTGASGDVKKARRNRNWLVAANRRQRGAQQPMPHSASRRVTIEHIATEPMSGHQREQAIMALATLITAWQHDPDQPHSAALPLPGPASDTDHAA